MSNEPEPVVVTVLPNEIEAELACALLREEGIKCGHRMTNSAAGGLGMASGAGAREVCVAPDDLARATELLVPADEPA